MKTAGLNFNTEVYLNLVATCLLTVKDQGVWAMVAKRGYVSVRNHGEGCTVYVGGELWDFLQFTDGYGRRKREGREVNRTLTAAYAIVEGRCADSDIKRIIIGAVGEF